jgi:hypothetical protein
MKETLRGDIPDDLHPWMIGVFGEVWRRDPARSQSDAKETQDQDQADPVGPVSEETAGNAHRLINPSR